MRNVSWMLLVLLALWVASITIGGILTPEDRSPFMAELFGRMPTAMLVHLAGGALAVMTGAVQINRRLRERSMALHRWLGMLYVLGVVAAGSAALPLAVLARHDWITRTGLTVLAILWLATTLLGFEAIRRRDVPNHRRWMLRSYAITVAAIMLRVYMSIASVLGLEFEAAYRVVVWACWVPNLVATEAWLVRRMRGHVAMVREPIRQ